MTDYLRSEFYDILKEDNSVLECFHDSCIDGVFYWDLEEPENQWVSDGFWRVLGHDDVINQPLSNQWKEMIYPEELDKLLSDLRKSLTSADKIIELIVPLLNLFR